VRDATLLEGGGCNRNRIWQFGRFPGSAPSSSGKGEACIRDLFNFYFKDVGADAVGEMWCEDQENVDLYTHSLMRVWEQCLVSLARKYLYSLVVLGV
jgi:hypothetical protein